jgi:hypothetical protein
VEGGRPGVGSAAVGTDRVPGSHWSRVAPSLEDPLVRVRRRCERCTGGGGRHAGVRRVGWRGALAVPSYMALPSTCPRNSRSFMAPGTSSSACGLGYSRLSAVSQKRPS